MQFDATATWYTASTIAQVVAALLAVGAFLAHWKRSDTLGAPNEHLEELREYIEKIVRGLQMSDPDLPPTHKLPKAERASVKRMPVLRYLTKQYPTEKVVSDFVAQKYDGWHTDETNLIDLIRFCDLLAAQRFVIEPRLLDGRYPPWAFVIFVRRSTVVLQHIRRSLMLLFSVGGLCLLVSIGVLPFAKLANQYWSFAAATAVILGIFFVGSLLAGAYLVWATLLLPTGWRMHYYWEAPKRRVRVWQRWGRGWGNYR